MKQFIILISFVLGILALLSATNGDWREVQSIVVPDGTPLYHYYTEKGTIKYVLSLRDMNISVSKANAEKYLIGQCKLEIVKWYNQVNGKYKYTTRQYKSNQKDIDLQLLFESNVQPITYFKPSLNED